MTAAAAEPVATLTASQLRCLRRVAVAHVRRGERYVRAISAGERVTLASLERRGMLQRRAWRGDGISRDSAFEYRLTGYGLHQLTAERS